jgi:hypothetical protein
LTVVVFASAQIVRLREATMRHEKFYCQVRLGCAAVDTDRVGATAGTGRRAGEPGDRAAGTSDQLLLAREMAVHISPRPGFTRHRLTLHAAGEMLSLVDRARRFRTPRTP